MPTQRRVRRPRMPSTRGAGFASAIAPPKPPSVAGIGQVAGPLGGGFISGLGSQPSGMPQPFDPGLEAAKQNAIWQRGISDAETVYQRGQLAYNTGYDASGARNAANPYSQAQLLQDSYRRSVMGTQTSYAAQGRLHGGGQLNAQARNDREYAIGSDQLRRQAMDAYHQLGFGQLQAYGQNSLGLSQEQFEALRRAVYGS